MDKKFIFIFALIFLVGAFDLAEAKNLNITSNGNNLFFINGSSGNVGIGTTIPGNTLSIATVTGDTLPALGANGGKFGLFNTDTAGGSLKYGLIGGALSTGNVFLQAQRVDGTATAYNMLLQPSGGNVGIGTTSPQVLLHINNSVGPGTARIQGTSYAELQLYDVGGGTSLIDQINGAWNGVTNPFVLQSNTRPIVITPVLNSPATGINILTNGNVGIGTITPATKLQLNGGDISLSNSGAWNSAGTRYGDKISLLTNLKGRQVNDNPDFMEGTNGYTVYDNGASGSITFTLIANTSSPSSSGRILKIDHSNVGIPAPGFGGFYKGTILCSNIATGHCIREGDRNVVRIWANIPVGYTINWATNSMGTGGTFNWLSNQVGTGAWEEYIAVETLGTAASSTNFFYISGPSRPFTWYVASMDMIDVDAVADVDRADSLNVGGKLDVVLGTGNLLSTQASYLATDGGNVGIGTTSPYTKMQINTAATNGIQDALALNNPSAYGIGAGTAASALLFTRTRTVDATHLKMAQIVGGNLVETTSASGYLAFGVTDGTATMQERMRIIDSGNVGIGTTNPGSKLEVAGTMNVSSLNVETRIEDNSVRILI